MKRAPLAAGIAVAVLAAVGVLAFALGRSRTAKAVTTEAHSGHDHDDGHAHEGQAHSGHDHGHVELYDIGVIAEGAVELATIEERALDEGFAANGRVVPRPNQVAQVGPLVSGRIVKLLAAEGQQVKAGQVLAYVESTEVTQVQAAHQQATSRLKAAMERLQNVKKLAREGVFTAKPVDEVRRERAQVASELASMRADQQGEGAEAGAGVKVAEAALSKAEASVKVAQTELDRRRSFAEAGAFQYQPLEEAKREKAEAEAALRTAESALKATESHQKRVRKLIELGTASRRELESADAARSDAKAAMDNTQARMTIAQQALAREQRIFDEKLHSRGEIKSGEAAVAEAEEEVQEKRSELARAKQRLTSSRSSERAAALKETENRLAALDDLLKRESSVSQKNLLAVKEVQHAEVEVAAAKADQQAAADALRLFKATPGRRGAPVSVPLTSPLAGVVTHRSVKLGETVDPTTNMFTVMDLGKVWVELSVYQRDLNRVSVGQTVRLERDHGAGGVSEGRIVKIGEVVGEEGRAVKVSAEVVNPGFLRPNMYVTGFVVTGGRQLALTVPLDAVADEGGSKAVYIKWPNGKGWERHPVEVIGTDSQYAAIVGPAAGERVATKGLALVQAAIKSKIAGAPQGGHGHVH